MDIQLQCPSASMLIMAGQGYTTTMSGYILYLISLNKDELFHVVFIFVYFYWNYDAHEGQNKYKKSHNVKFVLFTFLFSFCLKVEKVKTEINASE